MNIFRIAGTAFGGDSFDYTVQSGSSMLDFVIDDVGELTGNHPEAALVTWVSGKKVYVDGMDRLYLIEWLKAVK